MRIHPARNPTEDLSLYGRIRCGSGRFRSKLVQPSDTKTHWGSLMYEGRIRCGSGRIRWDPLKQAAPKHTGHPLFRRGGSDGGSGGARGGRRREQVRGFPHVEGADPMRIRADPRRLTARNHGRVPSFQRIRCGSGGGLLNRTVQVHRSCVSWGQTTRPYVPNTRLNAW